MAEQNAVVETKFMPKGQQDEKDFEQLLLDPDNPRLSAAGRTTDQFELLKRLWQDTAVDEIVYSVAYNGFYNDEALLVVPNSEKKAGPDSDKYIVVEGNRRLAAVLILSQDVSRDKLKASALPRIGEEAKERLAKLPVIIFESREIIWTYLGFRHINGTKPWDSISKAKHIKDVHENYGVPLNEIAERIGDRHSTVIRLYKGLKILQQAEEMALFDVEDRYSSRFAFSHLYTAIDQSAFQQFLGIDTNAESEKQVVLPEKKDHLAELMVWLYGRKSENKPPIIRSQNPDLNRLREVIGNPPALDALRTGRSLERAHEISIGDDRRFRESISTAKEELQQAKGTVLTGYSGEKNLFEIANDIKLLAESLVKDMQAKRS